MSKSRVINAFVLEYFEYSIFAYNFSAQKLFESVLTAQRLHRPQLAWSTHVHSHQKYVLSRAGLAESQYQHFSAQFVQGSFA